MSGTKDSLQSLIHLLRANVTDPSSRGTAFTETITGTAGTLAYTTTNKGIQYLSVTVDSVAKVFGKNYTVDLGTASSGATITFATAPGLGATIVVTGKKTTSWVYSEFSRNAVTYPIISVKLGAGEMKRKGLGDISVSQYWLDGSYDVVIHSKSPKERDEIAHSIMSVIQQNPAYSKFIKTEVSAISVAPYDNGSQLYRCNISVKGLWDEK